MARNLCCPKCGSPDLQLNTETSTHTTGSNYSAGKGCLGYLIFGPLGLLCGSCGQGQTTTTTSHTYWHCKKCGKRFKDPDELRREIASKQKPFLKIMCIIGAVFSLLFLFIFGGVDFGIALMIGLFAFGIFALSGFIAQKANDAACASLGAELYELEDSMREHTHGKAW